MKFKTVLVAMGFALSFNTAVAGEHPNDEKHEHPAEGSEKNPEPKKDEKKKEEKKKGKKEKDEKKGAFNPKTVETDLLAFISSEKKASGVFSVSDTVTKITRNLTLDKIHSNKIVQLKDGKSFVCADFNDANGEKVDVDFFMTATDSGAVAKVHRIDVHKVNGVERYTYIQENGVWIQKSL